LKHPERRKNLLMPFQNIKISIVIPCHNHGEFLRDAVQSVFASDFHDYEIIIVNDGSEDEFTLKALRELEQDFSGNPNLRIIHQENMGVAPARNKAIQISRGEYILPLDADDKIRPHYLGMAAAILDNKPDVGVVYPHARLFGEREGILEFPPFEPERLLLHNSVVVSSVYRKKIWETCGGYDPKMKIGYEDWEFWICAMEMEWNFHFLEGDMFDYRIRHDSRNSACHIPENRQELIRYICGKHRDTYAKHLEYVISEKEAILLRSELHIRDLEAIIREKEGELSRICNSHGWKALSMYYRFINKVFPMNSRRRQIAKHILGILKSAD